MLLICICKPCIIFCISLQLPPVRASCSGLTNLMYIASNKIDFFFVTDVGHICLGHQLWYMNTIFWCASCRCLIIEPVSVCIRNLSVHWACRIPDEPQGIISLLSASVLVYDMMTEIRILPPRFIRYVPYKLTLQCPSLVLIAQFYFRALRYWV